ncbi:MAG: type II toxin-antitoxin system RelE/ParE family toxin [Pseudomonas sp.]
MTYQLKQTSQFDRWLSGLRDARGKVAILRRLDRIRSGHLGDTRSVGIGVSEIRLDIGPGYRVYFTRRGDVVILLLCGGDKSSQQRDIKLAQQLAGDFQ